MSNDSIIFSEHSNSPRLKSYSSFKDVSSYTNTELLKFTFSRISKILARFKLEKEDTSFFIYSVKADTFN